MYHVRTRKESDHPLMAPPGGRLPPCPTGIFPATGAGTAVPARGYALRL